MGDTQAAVWGWGSVTPNNSKGILPRRRREDVLGYSCSSSLRDTVALQLCFFSAQKNLVSLVSKRADQTRCSAAARGHDLAVG